MCHLTSAPLALTNSVWYIFAEQEVITDKALSLQREVWRYYITPPKVYCINTTWCHDRKLVTNLRSWPASDCPPSGWICPGRRRSRRSPSWRPWSPAPGPGPPSPAPSPGWSSSGSSSGSCGAAWGDSRRLWIFDFDFLVFLEHFWKQKPIYFSMSRVRGWDLWK